MFKLFVLSLMLNQNPVDAHKVKGLELTPPMTVKASDGFVIIDAKCNGTVKWLLVSDTKVKYVEYSNQNSVIVSVPTKGDVSVFAIGQVDGKMTDFAVTKISLELPPPKLKPAKSDPPIPYTIKW